MYKSKRILAIASFFSAMYKYCAFIYPERDIDNFTVLLLQLSGARGPFGFIGTPHEIIRYLTVMLPELVLTFFLGRALYSSFCTGSVYVLSRHSKKKTWLAKELFELFYSILFYFALTTGMICGVAACINNIIPDRAAIIVALLHIYIYALWFFSQLVLYALIAIKRGSSEAMLYTTGYYAVLLMICSFFARMPEKQFFLEMNPISHMFLNWYDVSEIVEIIVNKHYITSWKVSVFYMLVYTMIVVTVCGRLICRDDMIINDKEAGTI